MSQSWQKFWCYGWRCVPPSFIVDFYHLLALIKVTISTNKCWVQPRNQTMSPSKPFPWHVQLPPTLQILPWHHSWKSLKWLSSCTKQSRTGPWRSEMSILLITFPEGSKPRQWTVVVETWTVQPRRQPDLSKTVASGARFSAERAAILFLIHIFRYVFPSCSFFRRSHWAQIVLWDQTPN